MFHRLYALSMMGGKPVNRGEKSNHKRSLRTVNSAILNLFQPWTPIVNIRHSVDPLPLTVIQIFEILWTPTAVRGPHVGNDWVNQSHPCYKINKVVE